MNFKHRLQEAGLAVHCFTERHWRVSNGRLVIDFWPSTQTYLQPSAKDPIKGMGMEDLLKEFGPNPPQRTEEQTELGEAETMTVTVTAQPVKFCDETYIAIGKVLAAYRSGKIVAQGPAAAHNIEALRRRFAVLCDAKTDAQIEAYIDGFDFDKKSQDLWYDENSAIPREPRSA